MMLPHNCETLGKERKKNGSLERKKETNKQREAKKWGIERNEEWRKMLQCPTLQKKKKIKMIFPNPKQRQTPLLTQVAFTPVLEDSNNYTMSLHHVFNILFCVRNKWCFLQTVKLFHFHKHAWCIECIRVLRMQCSDWFLLITWILNPSSTRMPTANVHIWIGNKWLLAVYSLIHPFELHLSCLIENPWASH